MLRACRTAYQWLISTRFLELLLSAGEREVSSEEASLSFWIRGAITQKGWKDGETETHFLG